MVQKEALDIIVKNKLTVENSKNVYWINYYHYLDLIKYLKKEFKYDLIDCGLIN